MSAILVLKARELEQHAQRIANACGVSVAPAKQLNPTLVHHGLAASSRWHIITGEAPVKAVADLYVGSQAQAHRVGRLLANLLGKRLKLLDNDTTPGELKAHLSHSIEPTLNPSRSKGARAARSATRRARKRVGSAGARGFYKQGVWLERIGRRTASLKAERENMARLRNPKGRNATHTVFDDSGATIWTGPASSIKDALTQARAAIPPHPHRPPTPWGAYAGTPSPGTRRRESVPPYRLTNPKGPKFSVGDRVQYTAAFLRSTGLVTGPTGRMKGSVTGLEDWSGRCIAVVKWDGVAGPERMGCDVLKKITARESNPRTRNPKGRNPRRRMALRDSVVNVFGRKDMDRLTLNETIAVLKDIAEIADSGEAGSPPDDGWAAFELRRRIGGPGNLKSYAQSLVAGNRHLNPSRRKPRRKANPKGRLQRTYKSEKSFRAALAKFTASGELLDWYGTDHGWVIRLRNIVAAGPTRNPRGRNGGRNAELAKAHETAAMWLDNDDLQHQVTKLPKPKALGSVAVSLGELVSVDYKSDKYTGDPNTVYTHKFKSPRPHLLTDPEAQSLHIAGGRVKVTRDGLVN